MTASPQHKLTDDILTENVWTLMRRLSLPAIIGMSINGINAFVDGLFVGQFLGQEALAAVSLAFPLMMVTNGISAMIGVGSSSLLSIAIGAGDVDTQRKIFGTLTALSLICSLLLSILGIVFAPELIGFMGGTGEILSLGVTYYRIMMIGAFFRIFAVAANMLVRAEGKIKEAMVFSIIAALLNIVLNPIFIYYLDGGIAGAAWATVVAMAVFTVLGAMYYVRGKANYEVSLRDYSLSPKLLRPILSVGVSAMMMQMMFFVQQVIVFKLLAHYGEDWDIAFMGSSYRVLLLILFPSFGFAQALQPVVGINYGAGQYKRVKSSFKAFGTSATATMTAAWLFIMIQPQVCLSWMMPEATFTATDLFDFRMMMLSLPTFPIFFMSTTLFQAIGNARVAGFLMIARELLLFVPIVFILPLFFGVSGIYYAAVPVNIIVLIVMAFTLRSEFAKLERT